MILSVTCLGTGNRPSPRAGKSKLSEVAVADLAMEEVMAVFENVLVNAVGGSKTAQPEVGLPS